MEKTYLFYDQLSLEFPLHESINTTTELDGNDYLVANIQIPNTEIYAPEINFYIRNSEDSIGNKIDNIKKLYDIRALTYDLSQDLDYMQEVGNRLLLVSDESKCNVEALEKIIGKEGFTLISLPSSMIQDVYGNIGKLKVIYKKDKKILELETDQIIWFNAPDFAMKQSGTFDPNIIGLEKSVEIVKENIGLYQYKNFIKYDSSICQYHERREDICGKCADVCPTVAILKVDENKHLKFSHIDCHGCGGCVSVCPSGALDYSQMPRAAFTEICSFYKDKVPLIIPRKMDIENLSVRLPKNVLPLAIEGEKFLHESHMISLIQTSGYPIIFYTDFISKGTGDVIRMINEIFGRKYSKTAIFICKDQKTLMDALHNIVPIKECVYGINEEGMKKREIFSARLAHLVGEDDLGVIKTGEHVHYGNITINQDTCTLCLSCVGACNVKALTSHPEDNTLRFNPSICTNCGYCEYSCPEDNCLKVIKDELSLNSSYFKQNVMATDEIFKCVECGVGFATVKSVERIANMMKPVFGDDEYKVKSLYCCADCKPKIMLQAHLTEKLV